MHNFVLPTVLLAKTGTPQGEHCNIMFLQENTARSKFEQAEKFLMAKTVTVGLQTYAQIYPQKLCTTVVLF